MFRWLKRGSRDGDTAQRDVYVVYSKSHEKMVKQYLAPSLGPHFRLHRERFDQLCRKAEFRTEGWQEAVKTKIAFLCKLLEKQTEAFWFLDADVQVFDGFREATEKELQESADLYLQRDVHELCSGVMLVRPSAAMLQFFQIVLREFDRFPGDQLAINTILKEQPDLIRVRVLPDTFWNYGMLDGSVWDGKKPFEVPEGMVVHHANWTYGPRRKLELLDMVRSQMARRKRT